MFQRAIIKALWSLSYLYVVVYIDDVLVVVETKMEPISRLQTVIETLIQAGFSFNFEKCKFLKSKIEYLGYEVETGELRPYPRKLQALVELPPPQMVTQLRQFIGLASYFRQFVPKSTETLKRLFV